MNIKNVQRFIDEWSNTLQIVHTLTEEILKKKEVIKNEKYKENKVKGHERRNEKGDDKESKASVFRSFCSFGFSFLDSQRFYSL